MFFSQVRKCSLLILAATLIATFPGLSQTVTGVTDEQEYDDQASFSVSSQAGFDISAWLNNDPIPLDTVINVTRMDYYEITVATTPQGGGTTTTNITQFILIDSNRGSPERGLIAWLPYPSIPSTSAEFAGATLDIISPQDYPQGLEIPVVAWVTGPDNNTLRANGFVTAGGFENNPLQIRRGVGSGFLPPATTGGIVNYDARLQGLADDEQINIEATTSWTPISGELPGATTWPENSRLHFTAHVTIPSTATFTVGAGTVIKLDPGVNITNSGAFIINGTRDRPVVLTATNQVAPEVNTFAWGGFVMRGVDSILEATGTIIVGGGGASSQSFSPGGAHRPEQAVLFLHSGCTANLTNCYVLNTAGQCGNGYNATINFDHCLFQRAITCGEYVGSTLTANHSAIIEFPEDNNQVNPDIVDGDYDAIYFTTGTYTLLNSLVGYCKDDAIDSGSGGAGSVTVSNCWIEAALHEALAWSGGGRVTDTRHTVTINSGQGIECGWSQGGGTTPLCFADGLLSLANSVGARYGDNYDSGGLGEKYGLLTITNSLILHNYRDVWGRVWADNDWAYRAADMDLQGNHFTQPNSFHPNNATWNPATDAALLVPFMTTPPAAPVGIGIATWENQAPISRISEGVPVRLSTFNPNVVSMTFQAANASGTLLQSGTLTFMPGETVRSIPVSIPNAADHTVIRVSIGNPSGGEITGANDFYYFKSSVPQPPASETLIPRNSVWKYHNLGQDLGDAWRAAAYDDSAWSAGPGSLGFDDNGTVTTLIDIGPEEDRHPTIYFRRTFVIDDPSDYGEILLRLRRDDGGVVYINNQEIFRSNLPAGTISYSTLTPASTPSETEYTPFTFGLYSLMPGTNVIAVEIHQASADSSDLHFDLELIGMPPSPVVVTPLIARGSVWSYHDLGEDLGTAWRNPGYDDSAWSSGPGELGFGDTSPAQVTTVNGGPSGNRHITIYFRHTFIVTNLQMAGSLDIGLLRDDGGVVYLNGQELFRDNMPQGPVSYSTFTPDTTPSETAYAPYNVPGTPLVLGANVIAVEIHQADLTSSDLSFDLEMSGTPAPEAPPLTLTRFGADLLLYWGNPAFAIEEAPEVTGPWTEAALGSLLEVQASQPAKFFRLRQR